MLILEVGDSVVPAIKEHIHVLGKIFSCRTSFSRAYFSFLWTIWIKITIHFNNVKKHGSDVFRKTCLFHKMYVYDKFCLPLSKCSAIVWMFVTTNERTMTMWSQACDVTWTSFDWSNREIAIRIHPSIKMRVFFYRHKNLWRKRYLLILLSNVFSYGRIFWIIFQRQI